MTLRLYQYAGHTIASHTVFPELRHASDSTPTMLFEVGGKYPSGKRGRCLHEWRKDAGPVRMSLHSVGNDYLLHFKRLAHFQVARDFAKVRCAPCPTRSTALVRHLFLDLVMPQILAAAGDHVQHASAVEIEGRAVAFVGGSGAGKSTTAAAFGQHAGRILADDCVILKDAGGEFFASAPYISLRLWEDSAAALELGRGQAGHRNGKRRFRRASRLSFAAGPSPLSAICLLDRSARPNSARLTRVPPAEALILLVKSAFRFDTTNRLVLEREFRFLSRLVASVPCYRLTMPDRLDALPSVRTLVIDAVQSGRTRRIA